MELNTSNNLPRKVRYDKTFTVFTPTYNRVNTLNRVYNSLLNQTFKDFEWLIIDDGSDDNTEKLIEELTNKNLIEIRYYKQSNQGKHVAMEFAVQQAKGYFFLTLDSDDACTNNALERLFYNWNLIPKSDKKKYSAVTALCLDENLKPLSKQRFKIFDSNSLEIKFKYKFETEAWGFQKTDVLKEFKFNTSIVNNLIPESTIWFQIAMKYKTRYVNEYLRIYYRDLPSLSKSDLSYKIKGILFYNIYILNNHLSYFRYAPMHFIYYASKLSRYSFPDVKKIDTIFKKLNTIHSKVLFLVCIPIGIIFFIFDKLKLLKVSLFSN